VSVLRAPVVLVGMMGTGKTTVGRLLAERLRVPFLDSDAQVEATAGRTVADLWAERGERGFRRLESEALVRALDEGQDSGAVVAAAGGVVLDEGNRRLLRERGWVVWLRARPETLVARVGDGSGRPLLGDDPAGVIHELAEARRHLYADVASVVVDTDERSPEDVVDRVLTAIA